MVAELSEKNFNQLRFEPVKYIDKKNEERPTVMVDFKTLVWFVTKFDHNLRLKVINEAFAKLEQQKEQEKLEAVKQAKLPKVYDNGYTSVRGAISSHFEDIKDDVNESDVWDALVSQEVVVTRAKVTIKRELSESFDGLAGTAKHNMAVFDPQLVRNCYEKWIEAGKPIKSEYERLIEEFEQISEYYKEKIEEAKKKL